MINKFAQTFFTLVLIASAIACGQDEALTPNPSFTGTSSANQNTSTNGVMTADIAGNGWSGANISASRISGVINISGIASDNSLITLTLFDMGEGTYDISQVSNTLTKGWSSHFRILAPNGDTLIILMETETPLKVNDEIQKASLNPKDYVMNIDVSALTISERLLLEEELNKFINQF